MKVGVLFSGGKDSMFALLKAKNAGHDIVCLLTLESENKESYMFHTPSVTKVSAQAEAMNIPLLLEQTKGEKEQELDDLRTLLIRAKQDFGIEGVVTGAVQSVYQSSRIQTICNELDLEVFNPLWQMNQKQLLNDLLFHEFTIMIVGIFAYPLDTTWLGRIIDERFIDEVSSFSGFNVAGEGGEYETFVLNCPLFHKPLVVSDFKDSIEGTHSARREIRFL